MCDVHDGFDTRIIYFILFVSIQHISLLFPLSLAKKKKKNRLRHQFNIGLYTYIINTR